MGLPEHKAIVQSGGLACFLWATEWTYSDSSGAPLLDAAAGEGGAWTDFDPRVDEATRLVDAGTGITTMKFPRSRRARVAHVSLEPATPGTVAQHLRATVTALNALAGTCNVVFTAANGGALADPVSGSRCRLTLELEYR